MSGYKFKLQRVLDYKETLEELKKSEYGTAIQKLNEEKEILSNYISKKSEIIKQFNTIDDKINIGSFRTYNNYISEITNRIKKQEENVMYAEREAIKIQEELLEAMKEKKSFEKLKEKDYREFILEEKREEEKIMDQIVTFNTNTQ